jgi:hypothetical protein
MDEKPISIWKKPLHGLRSLFLSWLGLMIATWIIFEVIMLAVGARVAGEDIKLWAVFAVCATTAVFLVLFIHWLFCWRNFKRFLFSLACLVTLIALGYSEEDWRGKHDWQKFICEWEAKGEKFDFKDFVPPAVPDDQNFAMTPVVASCYDYILTRDGKKIPSEQRDTNLVNRLAFDPGEITRKINTVGNWAKQTTSNLKLWQAFYRDLATKTNLFPVSPQPQSPAADVLLALSKYDATVEELRQASQLPASRFPLNYDTECPADILLPHLAAMKESAQLLRMRAIAELPNGQSDKALADVQLSMRLVGAIRTEPFLISHLVRIAMTEMALQPVYEGLANRQWTDAQLVALNAELAKLDFLADYQFSMRGERAMTCAIIDFISKRQSYKQYEAVLGEISDNDGATTTSQLKNTVLAVGLYLMPVGWFAQNKLFIARNEQDWITGVVFPEAHLVSPQKYREVGHAHDNIYSRPVKPWNFLAKEFSPTLGAAGRKSSREQISVDLARTAIALERYRLAHGEFPELLDVLPPQFIAQVPHDVISGQSLKYRRTLDGQFVLYSVGWNEKDDGGVMFTSEGGTQPIFDKGDWVWRYPKRE